MIKTVSAQALLALGGGRSAYSRSLISLMFLLALVVSSSAESPCITFVQAAQRGLLVVAPRPDYPYEARSGGGSGGVGVFQLKFDYETGHLREVHVVKSTGNRYLDGNSIGALKLWQAKPHSIHCLSVEVTFKATSRY